MHTTSIVLTYNRKSFSPFFFAQAGFCSSCKRLGIEQNNVGKRKAISQGVSYLRPVDPVSKG